MNTRVSPASQLVGMKLPEGWLVVDDAKDFDGKSGGTFSYGYSVERGDERAFLKAFDYLEAMSSPNPAAALRPLVEMYEFERELHDRCSRMNRVVKIVGHGSVQVPGAPPPTNVVQYLLLELADGDLNWAIGNFDKLSTSYLLEMAHNAAVGLWQLHKQEIAHQDLKPSNLMIFNNGQHAAKVGDLGRAVPKGSKAPHSRGKVAGDYRYAPPERLYGIEYGGEWSIGRVAGDMYLLGSLLFSIFVGSPLTAALLHNIPKEKHYMVWRGTYEEIIPDLVVQFDAMINTALKKFPSDIGNEILALIRELANPDIERRGNVKKPRQQYSLETYVSKLDRLSKVSRSQVGRRR